MSPNLAADRLAKSEIGGVPARSSPPGPAPSPGAILVHPVALLALGVLLLNDWILKPSASFRGIGGGSWLTGKLSDAAGLVVGPLVVAAVLGWVVVRWAPHWYIKRRSTDSIAAIAISAVIVPFIACKLSPAAATLCADALSLFGHAAHIVPDPTDLAMLPFVYLAWWVMYRPAPVLLPAKLV